MLFPAKTWGFYGWAAEIPCRAQLQICGQFMGSSAGKSGSLIYLAGRGFPQQSCLFLQKSFLPRSLSLPPSTQCGSLCSCLQPVLFVWSGIYSPPNQPRCCLCLHIQLSEGPGWSTEIESNGGLGSWINLDFSLSDSSSPTLFLWISDSFLLENIWWNYETSVISVKDLP